MPVHYNERKDSLRPKTKASAKLPMLPPPEKMVQTLSELINCGKTKQAVELAATVVGNPAVQETMHGYRNLDDDANFHFQASLACRLEKRSYEAGWYRLQASNCPNYTPGIEVDFIRDEALALIRQGAPTMPWRRDEWRLYLCGLIESMKQQISQNSDPNRYGALMMTQGRMLYALGRYLDAFAICMIGRETMTDEQWRRNARFAMMRAAAHFRKGLATAQAKMILGDSGETNSRHKNLARLVANPLVPTRLTAVVYDIAERIKS